MVTLTIDDKQITVPEGALVIEAAKQLGIDIPYACHHRRLAPYGGCRVCLVEIERMPKLQTSCTTRVSEGMVVRTNTPAVIKARQGQIEFLLINHPLECPVCDKGGECELQALSYYHGRGESRFHEPKRHSPDYDFGPLVWRNMDRCIRCKRCVRFMDEVAGEQVINFNERGPNTVVDTFDEGQFDSIYSGNTVTICPVGALLNEPFAHRMRTWEPAYFRTVCPHCANGCNMQVGVRNNKVARNIVWENPDVNSSWLCDRGQFGFQFVNCEERVGAPLIKRDGEFVSASWEEALDLIANHLAGIREAHGPDTIGGIGSVVCTNEDNYLFQKFMRAVIGTNNIDHRLYAKSTSETGGLMRVFDYTAGTASLNGLRAAKAIILVGCDIREEQPVTALWVREAAVKKNAHLVVADTRLVHYAEYAHDRLHHRPGTEVPLVNGMINVILAEGLENKDYISGNTEGLDDLRKSVEGYSPAEVEELTGVPQNVLQEAARSFAQVDGGVILYGRAVLEHPYSDEVIRALANLALVTGNVGKPNGGIMPIHPDANSQGAADMGVLPDLLPGHLPAGDPVNRDAFSEAWNARLPENPGLGTAEMLAAASIGELKAMYIMGADPIKDFPDAGFARRGLEGLDFLVVQDIFMTETAKMADVVLPGRTYAEKDGTFTNVERRVQRLFQGMTVVGPVQAEWHTFANLAERMGYRMEYTHASRIMEEISRLVHTYGGMTYEWLGDLGVQWPSPVLYGGEYEYEKWRIRPADYTALSPGDPDYPVLLLTREVLFNGDAMVRNSQACASLIPEAWVEINPDDARDFDIADGDKVRVSSPKSAVTLKARVCATCRSGSVIIPRGMPDAPVNVLMDRDRDADYVKIEKEIAG